MTEEDLNELLDGVRARVVAALTEAGFADAADLGPEGIMCFDPESQHDLAIEVSWA